MVFCERASPFVCGLCLLLRPLSISATTRAPREGEVHGREYFFITTEEFEAMIEREELVEYAKYVSNYYGTPKAYVEEQLNAGKNVILETHQRLEGGII